MLSENTTSSNSNDRKSKSQRANCWPESRGGGRAERERESDASRAPERNEPGELRRGAGGRRRRDTGGFVSEVEIRRTSSSDSLPPSLRHNTLRTAEEEEEEGRALSLSLALYLALSSPPAHVTAEPLSYGAGSRTGEKRGEGCRWREMEEWMDGREPVRTAEETTGGHEEQIVGAGNELCVSLDFTSPEVRSFVRR